jgi:hypothetical protein
MLNNKKYHIGGLKVLSEVDLEIQESQFTTPDIHIKEGVVNFFDKRSDQLPRFEFSRDNFYLKVDDIAKFSVHNGKTIVVDKFNTNPNNLYKLFLKGSAWGALLHQRGALPFHASSVEYNDEGIMICGKSGNGKSTLSYNLMQHGANYLCDDITAIKNGKIQPSHVSIKLWEHALTSLGKDYSNLNKIRPELDKYYFIPENKKDTPINIKHIYIIAIDKSAESVKIAEPKGLNKFNVLKSQIYRKQFIENNTNIIKHYSDIIFNLSQNSRIRIIYRPEKCDINLLTKAVIQDINNQKAK